MRQPRVLILGSGTATGGGSGPRMLIKNALQGVLNAEIIGLVTHYPNGGVVELGKEFDIPTLVIENFPIRKEGEDFSDSQLTEIREIYANVLNNFGGPDAIDFILLSGWMKYVLDLPTTKTVNIHPCRVDGSFGGRNKYGDLAHQHVFKVYENQQIEETAITMHFVTDRLDDPSVVIAQQVITLYGCQDWKEAKSRVVGKTEHAFQLTVTQALLAGSVHLENGLVVWDPDFQFEDANYHKGTCFE